MRWVVTTGIVYPASPKATPWQADVCSYSPSPFVSVRVRSSPFLPRFVLLSVARNRDSAISSFIFHHSSFTTARAPALVRSVRQVRWGAGVSAGRPRVRQHHFIFHLSSFIIYPPPGIKKPRPAFCGPGWWSCVGFPVQTPLLPRGIRRELPLAPFRDRQPITDNR